MGVYEGRGQLTKALKELMLRWSQTRGEWEDAVSSKFEKDHLEPLDKDLRSAMGAMDHMAIVLQRLGAIVNHLSRDVV